MGAARAGDPISKDYFLPYQNDWINDPAKFRLGDKSRRIGLTYAESYRAVRLRNTIDHRRDYWFSSADESSSVEFSAYCQDWCKLADAVYESFTEVMEDDLGYKYNSYVVQFPNGSRINCMSSNPKRFRSKGGDVCLDEFDFHEQPSDMLKAAMPVTTWGFDFTALSTRNGEGSEFDKLCQLGRKVKAREIDPQTQNVLPWSYHILTLVTAIRQGLAEKVKFTGPVKEHLASLTLGRFQDRRVRVPDDASYRESFHSIRKTVTAAGNTRYDDARTDEGHADEFWAHALCNEAASQQEEPPQCFYL